MTTPSESLPVSLPTQRPAPLLAWVLLVLLALVWGSSFILIKRSLVVFSPAQVGTARITFAFLFFLPLALVRFRQFPRRHGWALLASGLLGYLFPAFLFAVAGAHLSSSLAGALNSLSPLFTLVLGALFFGNRLRPGQVGGVLLGLVGSLFLVFLSASGTFAFNGYAFLLVIATFCYGINLNLVSKRLSDLPALTSTTWMFGLTGPIALLGLLMTDFPQRAVQPASGSTLILLVIMGVVSSGLATILFNRVIQLSSAVFASSVTYLIPIVALLWGMADGEPLYWPQLAGMAICLIGVYLVNRK